MPHHRQYGPVSIGIAASLSGECRYTFVSGRRPGAIKQPSDPQCQNWEGNKAGHPAGEARAQKAAQQICFRVRLLRLPGLRWWLARSFTRGLNH